MAMQAATAITLSITIRAVPEIPPLVCRVTFK